MDFPVKANLPDVQGQPDGRGLAISRVGISALATPLQVRMRDGSAQSTVAHADLFVSLPAGVKGTHMSRFVELMEEFTGTLDSEVVLSLLQSMLDRLQTAGGELAIEFPFFVYKFAPASGAKSRMDYRVRLRAVATVGHAHRHWMEVRVPATSLCPCSKEISKYGAHNQRSMITICAELSEPMVIEELIEIAEGAASCDLYGVLKRPDEKWVTERAYENPKFVEDLVRDVALALNGEPRIRTYRVSAENFESIHNHSAYAEIECSDTKHAAGAHSLRPREAVTDSVPT